MNSKNKIFILIQILLITLGCQNLTNKNKENLLNMEATEMYFSKKELHLNQNTIYKLSIENKGKILHDWNVSEIPVKDVIKSGEKIINEHKHGIGHEHNSLHIAIESNKTAEISFNILKPGAYEYFCSVPGHKEAGMVGTIFVHE